MKIGLNFYRINKPLILSFVSFLVVFSTATQSFGQASKQTDEFDEFENEVQSDFKQGPSKPALKSDLQSPAVKTQKAAAGKVVSEAQQAYDQGDLTKATSLWWKQIEKLSRAEMILLAKAHEKKKEPTEMIRVLNILIGKNESDAEAHYLLGNANMLQKKSRQALEAYNTALELNPRYEAAYLAVAEMYEKRTPPNFYELRAIYQDMIAKIGDRGKYLAKICEIDALDETFEAAIASCKQAINKDSQRAENYVFLGVAQQHTGDTNAANQTLKRAADRFPKSELAQYHYGKVLEDKKNYPDAMKYYRVGTTADAKSARSWLGLAATSFELQKFDISLEAYKKACRFEHKNAAAFRKATGVLRNSRNSEWTGRFESAADSCTF